MSPPDLHPGEREWWCEHAWLPPGTVAAGVLVRSLDGAVTSVTAGVPQPPGAARLAGLVLPGLADTHSHAFHRALRGRTHGGAGTFWAWREQMYAVAARLSPDTLLDLARAAFAELALAGVTCVGEFHYLHHGPGGVPYTDPNATGHALVQAAREAGLRITVLDACYLAGGIDRPLEGAQLRYGDGDAVRWGERAEALRQAYAGCPDVRTGAAVHSVRAVPRAQVPVVAEWAAGTGARSAAPAAPLHAHLSEQPAENEQCAAAYGLTPTALLADGGALGPAATVVHATHLLPGDAALLGSTGTTACLCPTTERDLADGVGPAPALVQAGCPLALGSDSHAVADLFEEARAVELDTRLVTGRRGSLGADRLLHAATTGGHAALGWPAAGRLAPGAPADLVAVRLDSVRTAGGGPTAENVVFAAGAGDVTDVVVGGRPVVRGGEHLLVGDVGRALAAAVAAVLP